MLKIVWIYKETFVVNENGIACSQENIGHSADYTILKKW